MSEMKKSSSVERLDSQKWGRYEGEKVFEFMFNTFPAGLVRDKSPPRLTASTSRLCSWKH